MAFVLHMGRPKGSKNKKPESAVRVELIDEATEDTEVSGDVEICRVDTYNWALVEIYKIPELNKKTKEPNKNAGEVVQRTLGYYGNNLRAACISALNKQPNGTHGAVEIMKELIACEKRIIKALGVLNA